MIESVSYIKQKRSADRLRQNQSSFISASPSNNDFATLQVKKQEEMNNLDHVNLKRLYDLQTRIKQQLAVKLKENKLGKSMLTLKSIGALDNSLSLDPQYDSVFDQKSNE